MLFLTVVSNRKSNLIQVSAITTAKIRIENETWFNPPNSNNVLTNIGKSFLTILDKHSPKSHRLHRIFNHNNVKISYSAMPNFASVINSHNKKIMK